MLCRIPGMSARDGRHFGGAAAISMLALVLGCHSSTPRTRIELSSWPQIVASVTEEIGFRMGQPEVDRYLGRGWAPVEQDPDGRFFRWAIGDTVDIRIPVVEPRDLLLRIRCAPPPTTSGETQGLVTLVNGREADRRSMISRRFHWTEIPLPQRLLRRGWNTIALVPSLRTPREIDPRPLRFAVREVSWDSTRTVGTIQEEELELTKLSTAAGVRILAPGEAMSFALRLPRGTTLGLTCHGMGQASATLEVTGEPVGGGDERLWSGQVEPGSDPITITETTRHELRGVTVSVGRRSQGLVAITNVTADVPLASETGKLFLLVTVDGLRSDAVRQGGAALPALHGPAGERIAFLQAYTPSPAVVPCYCSVMTSYYPFVHGILDDGALGLSDAVPTLTSLLSSAGYQCAAVVSDPALSAGTSRLSRGFGLYSSPEGKRHRPAAEVADEAVRALFAAWPTMRPGFVWLHFSDPASAVDSASGGEGHPVQSYERAVAVADSCLGTVLRCLESLGLDGDLTLLVSAGHGIAAGAEDGRRLSHPLAQPVIHVPLMLRLPGAAPTRPTVGFPVSLLDIMPTILALAGVEPPQGIQGTNLLPLVEGQERWRTLFCEARGGVAVSAIGLPYKLVRATDTESPPAELGDGERLFDLASDPGETLNVLDRRVSKATDMVGEWNALIGSTVTRFRPVPIN